MQRRVQVQVEQDLHNALKAELAGIWSWVEDVQYSSYGEEIIAYVIFDLEEYGPGDNVQNYIWNGKRWVSQ